MIIIRVKLVKQYITKLNKQIAYIQEFFSLLSRLYMHLPLTTSHRYHHIGNAVDTYQLNMQQENGLECLSVDRRVLEMLQILVRQGFKNPFVVRSALKVKHQI